MINARCNIKSADTTQFFFSHRSNITLYKFECITFVSQSKVKKLKRNQWSAYSNYNINQHEIKT